MSFGTHGNSAIPDRLCVEYAPTGRAACKTCGSSIAQDAVKLGEKVRSPWHDGFDIKWHHATPRCGLRYAVSNPHDLKGLQRLRWADQVGLAENISEGCSQPEAAGVKRLNEMVWEVRDRLVKVPKAALRELIELNGVYVSDKATPAGMLHGISDGIINGKLKPCPWCAGESLELEGTLLRCYGYTSGSTHCTFKASTGPHLFGGPCVPTPADPATLERTGPWIRTPAIDRALKGWALPPDAPVHRLGGAGGAAGGAAAAGAGAGAAGAGAGAASGARGKAKGKGKAAAAAADVAAVDDVSEDEEIAHGHEMMGMSFGTIGTLQPPAKPWPPLPAHHRRVHLLCVVIRGRYPPAACKLSA